MKILSKSILKGTFFFALSALSIVADQLSKDWMRTFLETKPGRELQLVPGFATLVYRYNTGGAFSLYDNTPLLFIYLPLILSVVLLALLIVYIRQGGGLPAAGISLMLGGATGNLIDRIRQGKVFDYLDCYIGNLHWPAFNVADICICTGMFLFIIAFIREEKCKSKDNCKTES